MALSDDREDSIGMSLPPPPSPPPSSSATLASADGDEPLRPLPIVLVHIILTAASAHLLPIIATHSRSILLALPSLHYSLLLGVAVIVLPRVGSGGSGFGGGHGQSRRKLTRSSASYFGEDQGDLHTVAMWAGVSGAASLALDLVVAESVNAIVWQNLEIYLLPVLVALPPWLSHFSIATDSTSSLPYASTAFLLAFSIAGTPTPFYGLVLISLKVLCESVKWHMTKKALEMAGSSFGAGGGAAKGVVPIALAGLGTSIIIPLVNLILSPSQPSCPIDYIPILTFLVALLLQTLTFLNLVNHLPINASPARIGETLLPRNLLLLCFSGSRFSYSTIAQIALALAGGTVYFFTSIAKGGRKLSLASPSLPTSTARQTTFSTSFLVCTAPFVILLLHSLSPNSSLQPPPDSYISKAYLSRPSYSPLLSMGTVDLVFSYYDEELEDFKGHLERMKHRPFILWRLRTTRVVVYNKGPKTAQEIRLGLGLRKGDEVLSLPNKGREGGTYISHILRLYNSTLLSLDPLSPPAKRHQVFATHTFFLQPHLAWAEISQPRLQLVEGRTGFFHFGPMMKSSCGLDERGNGDYPVLREIYNVFRGELCPPTGQLSAWSAQFVVSRHRILQNPYHHYEFLNQLIHADEKHWIQQTWGPNDSDKGDPANPAVGHALERSWPIIFGCGDPKLAEQCPDDVHDGKLCQCLD